MKNGKIVVIGSSNTDMVVQSNNLPSPGETVLGGEFIMNPGGKGANQAVAAAKLNGKVIFIAKVGKDIFGQEAVMGFQSHGIDTSFVVVDKESPSGVALIMVDQKGENCISVALGANVAGLFRGTLRGDAHPAVQHDAPYCLAYRQRRGRGGDRGYPERAGGDGPCT